MDSEQELNKKLAEWAGFKIFEPHGIYRFPSRWPDGEQYLDIPNFPDSLDACFKWLVPKLEYCDDECLKPTYPCHLSITNYRQEGHWTASIMPELYECYTKYEASADTPALALCKAIDKLIDKEDK